MASYHVLILCFCVFTAASGSHMQGGLMTFRARERNDDGTFVVEFKYKAAFIHHYSYEFYWYCSGWDCGYDAYRWHGTVPTSVSNAWYQTEGYIIRHLHNDKPFQLTESSCCWVYNSVGASGWNLVTGVDLGTRSDTFKPNNSPVTNIIPVIRVPNNCQSYINLLAFDPDGDIVRCRYGQYWAGECSNCNQPPKIYLDEARCSLSIPNSMPTGTYVLELVLEDFPHNNIYLRYNDGSIAYKYRPYNSKSGEVPKNSPWYYWGSTTSSYTDVTSAFMETTSEPSMTSMNGLSKIPLQFIVEVTSGLTSCAYGLYRPQFVYPTPYHGEILNATAGSEFQLHLSAQASYTSITDFKVSGPANLTRGGIFQSGSSTKDIVIQWTPSDSDIGDHIPFCFIAETSQRYQSELRCVLVAVESRVDVSASHMQGGLMSYRFKGTNHNGALVVDFKYKAAFDQNNDYQFSWFCSSGDCGSVVYSSYAPVESSSYPRPWYQTEGHFIRHLYNDKPFQLSDGGCCWVNNKVGVSGWNLLTAVDLGIRSDTSMPNNPPETSIIPVIRVPQNCPSSLNLMAHDPDGDIVRCRYGEPLTGECNGCNKHQYFSLDQNRCILSLSSTISLGLYVMELVLEDFPQKDIYLRYRDGTFSYKYRPYGRKRREAANNPARYFWGTTDGYGFTDTTTMETSSVPDSYTTDEVSTQAISDVTMDFVHETTLWLTTVLPTTTYLHTEPDTSSTTTTYFHTEPDTLSTTTTYFHTEPDTSSTTTTYLHTEPDTSSTTTTYLHPEPDTLSTTTTYFHTEPDTSSPTTSYLHATSVSISTPEAFPDTTLDMTTEAYTELITKTESTPSWHIPWTTQSWSPYTTHPTYEPTMPYLSKIPLQFIWEVTKAVPSCTYGEYRPKFLPPTPEQNKRLRARADTLFQIQLSAQALYSSITDFKVSGPSNITKRFTQNNTNSKAMTVEWTPSANDIGTHVPFCFLAETVDGYQSELRCIVIIVGPKISLNSTLLCNENTMTLIIEKSRESGLYENHLRLNDPRCLVSSNASHHIASVGFNSCGTQMEETENDIVFKNQITSFDNAYDVITRKHQVVIPFNCSFPKKTRVSAAFRAEKAVFEFTEAGFGNFTYKFQFYTDNQFTTVQTQYPLEVWLRDQLYMEVEVTSSVPNVQLFVESCKATPHDNPNDPVFYGIIDNGCLKDETLVIYPGTRTRSRFGMEAFAFIGNNEEVYVSCTVILCKFGDPNTRCSKGCLARSSAEPDAYRHKRSLTPEASESLQHFISQGPLRMKRQSSKKDSGGSSELNVNTLVMSVSGVVIVALIAVTVYISMKKARISRYKSLPTEDF